MNNKNYRVMKFFEPVNKKEKARGYVRLDIRGIRGNVIVSVENLGDVKSTSEVYLYKDKENKLKLGDINNKKGMIKKILTFGSNNAIEDYNVCAVVKNGKIALYSNLFNPTSLDIIKKLDETEEDINTSSNATKELDDVFKTEKIQEINEQEKEEIIEETQDEVKEEIQDELQEEIYESNNDVKADLKISNEEIKEIEEVKEVKEVKETEEIKENFEGIQTSNDSVEFLKHKNKLNENLYNTLKDYKSVEPLSVKIKNFNWWYIPYDEVGIKNGFLPYYNQIVSSYYPYPMSNRVTTCNSLMRKYGHYVFGIYKENDDIAKFIYGVPGEFTKEEQPYKGITGFKNWSYGSKENKKENGYWLAFVNPKTGEITDPPQIVLSK